MSTTTRFKTAAPYLGPLMVSLLLGLALFGIYLAPTEQTMGEAQRVMYVHISVAWMGLVGFVVMAACGLGYLLSRNLFWDEWSLAACEVGWMCATLTLVTGSFWAHSAWGTWWTWDPRLVTSFILWALYSGNLILRCGLDDAHQRARLCGVFAILGVSDVPLVVMATRWYRGIHPVTPEMEPSMRGALVVSVIGLSAVMTLLLLRRRQLIRLESRVTELQFLAEEV